MAIVFFEGFETYGPSASFADELANVFDLNDLVTQANVKIVSSTRVTTPTNGQALEVVYTSSSDTGTTIGFGPQLALSGLSSEDDWIFGAAFRFPGGHGPASSIRPLFEWLDSDGNRMLVLRMNNSGDVLLQTIDLFGFVSGTLVNSLAAIPADAAWHYVEAKIKFENGAGSFDVRVDESSIGSGSSANTSQTAQTRPSMLRFGHIRDGAYQIDDLYVIAYDDTDPSELNNDFLGDVVVQRVKTTGPGDQTDFASTGTNWQEVNEDAYDSNTSYVQSRTASDRDQYNFEDMQITTTDQIFGVVARPVLTKNDAGSRTYRLTAHSAGSTDLSPVRFPASSFVRQSYVWETDPDTGALWTPTAFNAAQFGIEVAS